jgi:hypothetical protein
MCRLFFVVMFSILLGCQPEYSSVLLRGVNSSVLILCVLSCYAVSILLLSGCQFFWDAMLCQYFTLFCCVNSSGLLQFVSFFSCYAVLIVLGCCSSSLF